MKNNFEKMTPDKFPELKSLIKKYEGKTIGWLWEYQYEAECYFSEAIEIDLYRLAATVFFEERQMESKIIRRGGFKELIKEYHEIGTLLNTPDVNSVFLSYCFTYDGPRKLLIEKQIPDIGTLVHQDIDKDNDLQLLMVPKDLFYKNYEVMVQENKSFITICNDGYSQLN